MGCTTFGRLVLVWLILTLPAAWAAGQDRETKVRNDRRQLADDESWLYNDLESGFAEARRTNRPLLIVLRCIP